MARAGPRAGEPRGVRFAWELECEVPGECGGSGGGRWEGRPAFSLRESSGTSAEEGT